MPWVYVRRSKLEIAHLMRMIRSSGIGEAAARRFNLLELVGKKEINEQCNEEIDLWWVMHA